MVSTYPLFRLTAFAETYGLSRMENVSIAKDPSYNLLSFYQVRSFPYLALYNKKGNLIRTFQGSVGFEKILAEFEAAK
jgi:thioredoxin-related protein